MFPIPCVTGDSSKMVTVTNTSGCTTPLNPIIDHVQLEAKFYTYSEKESYIPRFLSTNSQGHSNQRSMQTHAGLTVMLPGEPGLAGLPLDLRLHTSSLTIHHVLLRQEREQQ